MKLKDVESKELLPSWAADAEWLQNGLDLAVRSISARIPGMGAPFTLDAVKALSDEELEALYEQIGAVKYYPDLSRSTRESFIFEIYTNARYLGTPAVVEKLIKYIFDGQPVNVTIHDNLAFDSSGSLVDSSLLDTYDIELNIPVSNLPALVLSRLYENLYNLVRNTQKLRAVEFTFDDENIDCNTYFGIIPAETPGIVVDIENDAVCDMPPVGEVVLKVKWGDTVNVPAGYTVSEVRTFVGYVFPSYFNFIGSPTMTLAYSGKDEYFDNIINHDLLLYDTPNPSVSTWPIIEVFQGDRINDSDGPHMQGRRFTVGYNNSYSDWVTLVRNTNGTDATAGDYSIYMEGNYDDNARSSIQSGKPARLLWFETNGTVTYWHKSPEAFKVPQSLWSFSNGTFSWLGNSEDTSSLAWYYKHDWELFEWSEFDGVWFYVHCVLE